MRYLFSVLLLLLSFFQIDYLFAVDCLNTPVQELINHIKLKPKQNMEMKNSLFAVHDGQRLFTGTFKFINKRTSFDPDEIPLSFIAKKTNKSSLNYAYDSDRKIYSQEFNINYVNLLLFKTNSHLSSLSSRESFDLVPFDHQTIKKNQIGFKYLNLDYPITFDQFSAQMSPYFEVDLTSCPKEKAEKKLTPFNKSFEIFDPSRDEFTQAVADNIKFKFANFYTSIGEMQFDENLWGFQYEVTYQHISGKQVKVKNFTRNARVLYELMTTTPSADWKISILRISAHNPGNRMYAYTYKVGGVIPSSDFNKDLGTAGVRLYDDVKQEFKQSDNRKDSKKKMSAYHLYVGYISVEDLEARRNQIQQSFTPDATVQFLACFSEDTFVKFYQQTLGEDAKVFGCKGKCAAVPGTFYPVLHHVFGFYYKGNYPEFWEQYRKVYNDYPHED